MQLDPLTDTIAVVASKQYLNEAMDWIRGKASAAKLSSKASHSIELAMEEALVNVMQYAYQGKEGMIHLKAAIYPSKKIVFTIKDQGVPFNPLKHTLPVGAPTSLEETEEGGLGIMFITESADEVSYKREGNANFLTLIKNCV